LDEELESQSKPLISNQETEPIVHIPDIIPQTDEFSSKFTNNFISEEREHPWILIWISGVGLAAFLFGLYAWKSEADRAVAIRKQCKSNTSRCRNLRQRTTVSSIDAYTAAASGTGWSGKSPLIAGKFHSY